MYFILTFNSYKSIFPINALLSSDNSEILAALPPSDAPVPADGDLAGGAAVLHVLEAVHAEGHAEAGPQHREAEDGRDGPGHHAGLGADGGGDAGLAGRTGRLHRAGAEVRRLDVDDPDMLLLYWSLRVLGGQGG